MSSHKDPRTLWAACIAAGILAVLLVLVAGVPVKAGVIVWLAVWGIFMWIENPPRGPNSGGP